MKVASAVVDNIAELLFKIVRFAKVREKVLIENIEKMHVQDFVPKDLEVGVFSEQLNDAIDTHIRQGRLMFRDSSNIKFGYDGDFNVTSVPDRYARELLATDIDEYFQLEFDKLLENFLNKKTAMKLLRYHYPTVSVRN